MLTAFRDGIDRAPGERRPPESRRDLDIPEARRPRVRIVRALLDPIRRQDLPAARQITDLEDGEICLRVPFKPALVITVRSLPANQTDCPGQFVPGIDGDQLTVEYGAGR